MTAMRATSAPAAEARTTGRGPSGIARRLLEEFTPVEPRLLEVLSDEVIDSHWLDLRMRLSIAAEIAAPGFGQSYLMSVLRTQSSPQAALREIDSLLAFGCKHSDLSSQDRLVSERGEIRQEIQHFDRIMDLDTVLEGRGAHKRRREFVHQQGMTGAAERLFALVYERRLIRGAGHTDRGDLAAQAQQRIRAEKHYWTLRRTRAPFVAAVLATNAPSRVAETLIQQLEVSALKHPLVVAVGLTIYRSFLVGAELTCGALSLRPSQDGRRLETLAVSTQAASCLSLRRSGFRYEVEERCLLTGTAEDWHLHEAVTSVAERGWVALSLDRGRLAQHEQLPVALNRANGAGRIELAPNLALTTGGLPLVIYRAPQASRFRGSKGPGTDTVVKSLYGRLVHDGLRAVRLSLECGHVHADREVGPAQMRGLNLGADLVGGLAQSLSQGGSQLSLEVVPMVDDDHVDNRLSYSSYRQMFEAAGLPVADLILESSPILRGVAHDVLRRAIERDGQGYSLHEAGGNLYLESDGLRLELIEDLYGSMRNGCVMFEIALVAYRAARERIASVFWSQVGASPRDLHREMEDAYDSISDAAGRVAYQSEINALLVDPWEQVTSTIDQMPYLACLSQELSTIQEAGDGLVVLNVLEDYYLPQQLKVSRLATLLDIPLPMESVFFSPYGDGLTMLSHVLTDPGVDASERLSR